MVNTIDINNANKRTDINDANRQTDVNNANELMDVNNTINAQIDVININGHISPCVEVKVIYILYKIQ